MDVMPALDPDELLASLRLKEAEVAKLRGALDKINAIRDSIIGYQNVGWSAHIYPLVAALGEAGYEGAGYEKASAEAKTQVARIAELEEALHRIASEPLTRCSGYTRCTSHFAPPHVVDIARKALGLEPARRPERD